MEILVNSPDPHLNNARFDSAQQCVQGDGCDLEIIVLSYSGRACQTDIYWLERGFVQRMIFFTTRDLAIRQAFRCMRN